MLKITSFILVFAVSTSGFAQNFLGLQSSNWAGVNYVYSNPAGLADGRHRQHANFSTVGFSTSTNAFKVETPFTFMQLITSNIPSQYKNSSGGLAWDPAWFKLNNSKKNRYLNANLEWRGPAFMTRIGKQNAIAIATRTRFNFSVNNVNPSLVDFAVKNADTSANPIRSISNNSFSINTHAYQEISGSFARVLLNKNSKYLKVGVTGKYLMGIASGSINNKGINARLSSSSDTLIINSSDVEVNHSNIEHLNKFNQGGLFSFLTPNFRNINGSGLGLDVGAVFEWRPKITDLLTSKNKYLFKAGLSLMDIGTINMKQGITRYTASNNSPVNFLADSAFAAAFSQGTDSGLAYIKRFAQQNLNYKQGESQYVVNLPTTLSIQLDYNVIKWFYVGAFWNQSLVSKDAIALRRPSSFSLIPRVETKLFEVAVPVLVYDDYKQFGLGIFTRIGPVYFGSDNIIKSITGNSINGIDFYFGVSTGIGAKKKKKNK